jgi:hypothetical protein
MDAHSEEALWHSAIRVRVVREWNEIFSPKARK